MLYNNKDFLESIKDIKVEEDECIMSYDVSPLFTYIPIDTTINIIKKQLEEDKDLQSRNQHDHQTYMLSFRVLPKEHLFQVQWWIL